jgi:hypothetical protein
MHLFLPIAEASVSVPVLVAIGGLVGIVSGLFGVGGGFLLTPLLMVAGISPMVAAASGSAQFVASAAAGTIAHSRAGTVDYKMGVILFVGGAAGSDFGVRLLEWLNQFGPANSIIRVLYVVLLGIVGLFMLIESVRTMRRGDYLAGRRFLPIKHHSWIDRLPLHVAFPRSGIDISCLMPLAMGGLGGLLAAMMGVGGGFIMVPLMLYVLGMRMHVVAGTSLFQILFTSILVTVLQAADNFTVDVVLAFVLAVGSTAGVVIGTRLGRRLRADQLKILLAVMILAVALMVNVELFKPPEVLLSHLAGQ